jgi:thiosulfate dehydrogenase
MTMIRPKHLLSSLLPCAAVSGFTWVRLAAQQPPAQDKVTVTLCDGKTQMTVPDLSPGEKPDRERAQRIAVLFMEEWSRHNPASPWLLAQNQAAKPKPASPAKAKRAPVRPAAVQSGTYTDVTPREEFVWKTETEKFINEGNRIFHDADAFGGTIGVSCDMCHPDASNTHPETYPKYQVQMQRVALLRDMINWCIQHPAKGKPLADDDPRLRAMEAYIIAQRKGKAIEPGKR